MITKVIKPDKHIFTMFVLHGFSEKTGNMKYFINNMDRHIRRNTKFIMLQAPKRYINCYEREYYSWYNYFTSYCDKEEIINYSDVIKNTSRIKKKIDREASILNNDYSKIFIMGSSQGACQSLHTALSISKKLGGVIAFRGHVITNTPLNNSQHIFASHGKKDDTIGFNVAKSSYDKLNKHNITFHIEDKLDHFDESKQEIKAFNKWLNNITRPE